MGTARIPHLILEALLCFRTALGEDSAEGADVCWPEDDSCGGRGEGGGVNIDGRTVGRKERGRWPKPTGRNVYYGEWWGVDGGGEHGEIRT